MIIIKVCARVCVCVNYSRTSIKRKQCHRRSVDRYSILLLMYVSHIPYSTHMQPFSKEVLRFFLEVPTGPRRKHGLGCVCVCRPSSNRLKCLHCAFYGPDRGFPRGEIIFCCQFLPGGPWRACVTHNQPYWSGGCNPKFQKRL